MDLTNILKHCPKGTKLYSPIFGDCKLNEVNDPKNYDYPIEIEASQQCRSFTKEGKYLLLGNGECCLFPSRDQRDWNKFRLPCKRGDIMRTNNSVFLVYDVDKNSYPRVYCYLSLLSGDFQINENPETSNIYTSDFYYPADKEAIEYLTEAYNKAGYYWDPKTSNLKPDTNSFLLKEPEVSDSTQDIIPCLKPFDKVLISRNNSIWFPAFFWETCDGYYRTTDGKIYERCIPYKGNEHLLGTSSK